MEKTVSNPPQIKGWGVDANPQNDPTYPMKTHVSGEHEGYSWKRPPQQPLDVEVLHSNERPNVSAVFGTASPPAGLSGMLRRYAFKFSESTYAHWLPLMIADRIGVVEGVVDDLSHGHFPNLVEELGLKAELQHNRREFLTRLAAGAIFLWAAIAYLRRDD